MKGTKSVREFIHAYFIIRANDFYVSNSKIIDEFKKSPGLYRISEKRGLHVGQVYNIVKTHDINVLNVNIIKLMEIK